MTAARNAFQNSRQITAGVTDYPYDFEIVDPSYVHVYVTPTGGTEVEYTRVSADPQANQFVIIPNPGGAAGGVIKVAAITGTGTVRIQRETPYTLVGTVRGARGEAVPAQVDAQLTRLAQQIQQLAGRTAPPDMDDPDAGQAVQRDRFINLIDTPNSWRAPDNLLAVDDSGNTLGWIAIRGIDIDHGTGEATISITALEGFPVTTLNQGKYLRVNGDGTGVEWATVEVNPSLAFNQLTDTPPTTPVAAGGHALVARSTGAIVWFTPAEMRDFLNLSLEDVGIQIGARDTVLTVNQQGNLEFRDFGMTAERRSQLAGAVDMDAITLSGTTANFYDYDGGHKRLELLPAIQAVVPEWFRVGFGGKIPDALLPAQPVIRDTITTTVPTTNVIVPSPAPSDAGGWSDWKVIVQSPVATAAEVGLNLILGDVRATYTGADDGDDHGIIVETRLRRHRGAVESTLTSHVDNGIANLKAESGKVSTAYAAASKESSEVVVFVDDTELGDVYRVEARVIEQETTGSFKNITFAPTDCHLIVAPVSGVTSSATGGGGLDQAQVDARIINLVLGWARNAGTQIPVSQLGTGPADSTKVLYGDGTWRDAPSGGAAGVTEARVQELIDEDTEDLDATEAALRTITTLRGFSNQVQPLAIANALGVINNAGETVPAVMPGDRLRITANQSGSNNNEVVLKLSDLHALTAQTPSTQATSSNSLQWMGSDDSNTYSLSRHEGVTEVFLGTSDSVGAITWTINLDRIDPEKFIGIEDFAFTDKSDRVPVAKLGSGTADQSKVLHGDGSWRDAPTGGGQQGGGLTTSQVDARIRAGVADPAETGSTDRWAKTKLPTDILYDDAHKDSVFGAFKGTDTSENSTTIEVNPGPFAGDPSLATLRSVADGVWVFSEEVGPRQTNVWIAMRVPVAQDAAVQAGQRSLDVTESTGVFERYPSNTWTRKGTNVTGTIAYYTVEVADLPSGAMFLVREQEELALAGDLINADQWRTTLGLVGGVRYTLLTPTVQTTSSAQNKETASIAVSPAADLDDNLYRHGEWHIHVHGTASIVSPGSDPNFGYEQGKANQTDDDRTAEDTAIIFVGGADGLRAATDRTGGIGAGGGGIRVKRRPVYSLNTLLGYDVVILNRDSQNNVGVIGYFETAGGNALNYRFVNRVQIVYHPSDAPTLESLSGLTEAEVDARVRAGVADWAEQGASGTIPDNKIPSGIARDSEIPTNSEIDTRADARVVAGVQNWARDTTTAIPASKLTNAPSGGGGGLTQSQVDARVVAGTLEPARAGSSSRWPAAKLPASSLTQPGIVELADATETATGTDATRAVTPHGLSTLTSTTARPGLIELADQAQADAGTDNARAMTPMLVKRRVDAATPDATATQKGVVELATRAETRASADAASLDKAVTPNGLANRTATESRTGIIALASQSDADTGTDDTKAMTPALVKRRIDAIPSSGGGGSSTFTGLTDTPSAFTGEGGKYLAVNSGATAVEFVDAPSGGTGGGSTTSLAETPLSTATNITTGSSAGTWTSWQTLITSAALTSAGVARINGIIRGNITTDTTGGGDRVYVESRLVRTRSSVDTEIDWNMIYIRNGGNFGTQAIEDASQMLEKALSVADEGMVGDTYKVDIRVMSQLAARTLQLTTDSKLQVLTGGGAGGGGGSSTFTGLTDTPAALGTAGQIVQVNAGGTALEFDDAPSGSFAGLTDTPSSLTGQGGKEVKVNSGGTALEFVTPPITPVGKAGGKGRKIAEATLPTGVQTAGTQIVVTWAIESDFTSDYSQGSGELRMPRCIDHPGWVVEVMVGTEIAACSWINSTALDDGGGRNDSAGNYAQYYKMGATVFGGTAGTRAVNLEFQRQLTQRHLDTFRLYGAGQGALLANTKILIYEWSLSQGSVVTEITQADFDALSSTDDNTLYVVTS